MLGSEKSSSLGSVKWSDSWILCFKTVSSILPGAGRSSFLLSYPLTEVSCVPQRTCVQDDSITKCDHLATEKDLSFRKTKEVGECGFQKEQEVKKMRKKRKNYLRNCGRIEWPSKTLPNKNGGNPSCHILPQKRTKWNGKFSIIPERFSARKRVLQSLAKQRFIRYNG